MTRSQFAFLASCFIFVPILAAQTDRQPGNAFLAVQAPMPPAVACINGQPRLVYELHMTNFSPRTVTLTRIDLLSEHNLLNTYEGDALLSGLSMVGASARTGENPRLEGGHQAIFYVWLLLPQGRILDEIRHRISFRADDGRNFSTDAAQARIAGQAPVVLGPPLRGGPWVAIYDPSLKNAIDAQCSQATARRASPLVLPSIGSGWGRMAVPSTMMFPYFRTLTAMAKMCLQLLTV